MAAPAARQNAPVRTGRWQAWGLAAWGLAAWSLAGAAQAHPPVLPGSASAPAGFVPAGWQIAQQLAVDLNHDRRPDAVLLLQADTPAAPPGTGQSPQRVLAVLLQQRRGWALLAHNSRLVPQVDLASQEDPLANGELTSGKAGSFNLSLGLTSTAGSYASAVVTYRFRLERRCVRLIGHDQLQTQRATLDTQDTSINFLTGAVLVTSGNAQSDAATKQRSRLASNPRRCLGDLDSAVSFQPLGAPR